MAEAFLNGVRTHFQVHGEGTPLLFIPGGAVHPADHLFAVVEGRLPSAVACLRDEGVRIIWYHRRSYGGSDFVFTPYTVADLADDARSLLDHLGVARAIVVGHSAGGPLALQLALAHPARVHALCFADTAVTLHRDDESVGRARREGDRAAFEGEKSRLRDPPPLALSPDAPSSAVQWVREWHAQLVTKLAALSDEELFRVWMADLREKEAFAAYTPKAAELPMPTCIIYGTADSQWVVSGSQELLRIAPHAELHAIEGAGHGTIQGHPGAVEVFRDWVRREMARR